VCILIRVYSCIFCVVIDLHIRVYVSVHYNRDYGTNFCLYNNPNLKYTSIISLLILNQYLFISFNSSFLGFECNLCLSPILIKTDLFIDKSIKSSFIWANPLPSEHVQCSDLLLCDCNLKLLPGYTVIFLSLNDGVS